MKKASNDVLVVEELIEILKKIGKVRAQINVTKDCINDKNKQITAAILEWSRFELKAAASLIGTLCAGLDKNKKSSAFFEKHLNQYPEDNFSSIQDVEKSMRELLTSYEVTKSVYADKLFPLWKAAGENLEKAMFEIKNAIKSHK